MKDIDLDQPIVLALAGAGGVGKTVTADGLVPYGKVTQVDQDLDQLTINWSTHLFYAMPMYEILSVRRSIEGENARDRMRYEIHRILSEVWPSPIYGGPPYHQLVDIVEDIATYPCPLEGKARSFLQHIGTDVCRKWDEDCWIGWMQRKLHSVRAEYLRDNQIEYEDVVQGIVLSDCRFENELDLVRKQKNSILINLTASPEVLEQRQFERDGTVMTDEQKNHVSEQLANNDNSDMFDIVIDTDGLTVPEQVQKVKDEISALTGFNNHA